ncbi:MAG: hypothetical protein QME51_04980 [Planctomycetota bacterium]|nr:hypothetical protein [Planctomycetota bacterium]MDI6787705.1 hypothetical protein [Planctomycetota bacterium]
MRKIAVLIGLLTMLSLSGCSFFDHGSDSDKPSKGKLGAFKSSSRGDEKKVAEEPQPKHKPKPDHDSRVGSPSHPGRHKGWERENPMTPMTTMMTAAGLTFPWILVLSSQTGSDIWIILISTITLHICRALASVPINHWQEPLRHILRLLIKCLKCHCER